MIYTITVTWNPMFPERKIAMGLEVEASAEKRFSFVTEDIMTGEQVCSAVYAATNLYAGEIWDAMQPLPADRGHTAISMGDFITVNGVTYECAEFGWKNLNAVVA